ncbi:RHS repeat-associated core domain-containing protein [Flavobacterium columnare]|uniref:RHS repeat-associated core domain-containing protein n=1 Tax=Flavobacterium columnare TaxID=996 RepID=UPI004033A9E1
MKYYPFGSLIPNRHGSSTAYRYGFQGQEKDDEIKGEGNSLNYTFRMHDSRVGRFFAVDPLTHQYPWYSPYQFSGNKPIQFIEREGMEEMSPPISGDIDIIYEIFAPAKDGVRNIIWLPLLRAVQSDEQEGKQLREALTQLGFEKELHSGISNVQLANSFDLRSHSAGNTGVIPEEGVGKRLLTFVGDALDVASVMPTKSGVFLAVKTGIGANSISSILRGLKISSRTAEILQTFRDVGGQGTFRKVEAEGMAIFEETFKTTVRALDNIKDSKKAGDFIVNSGKYAGKSVDLVSAVNNKNFNIKKFIASVDAHYKKDGVDLVNIDIRALGNEAKEIVRKHIGGLSKENKARTILTERYVK